MKATRLFLAAAASVTILLTGCSKDDKTQTETYAVTVTDDGNGTAVADKTNPEEGETVKLTATPNDGYEFCKWTVESGGITFTDPAANPATFTMPAGAVSVKAEFVAELPAGAVATYEELLSALDSEGGTQADPVVITMVADIDLTGVEWTEDQFGNNGVLVKGHKVLDGGGYTLTRGEDGIIEPIRIFSDGEDEVALTVKNIIIEDKCHNQGLLWFDNPQSRLTLGPGTTITRKYRDEGQGCICAFSESTLIIDGADFRCDDPAGFGAWITMGAGNASSGNLILKDFTFGHPDDYILLAYTKTFRMKPGLTYSPNLWLSGIVSADFHITPTEGNFSQSDADNLRLQPYSLLDGAKYPNFNAEKYEFYLDGNEIKLRLKEEFLNIQPEANSYMVAPGGEAILIPVSRANKAADASHNLGADATGLGGVTADNYTVELVWSDKPVGAGGVIAEMRPAGEYVYVKSGVAGNAVICIKVDGDIKWSWHIWVTEAVSSKKDTETGLTWMDRNLGAAGTGWDADGKNGLYYQWGRKDAFPGSDGTNNNQTYYTGNSMSGTSAALPTGSYSELPELVANPLNFATNNFDYYGSLNVEGGDNKSWSGNAGEKTIYDPCPAGWKIPPVQVNGTSIWGSNTFNDNSEWTFSAYIGTNKGALFDGVNGTAALGHFYPATGWRLYNKGTLDYIGTKGYVWSATTEAHNGCKSLGFDNSSIWVEIICPRSYGQAVRCVAE